jgi:hypothetical protein
VYINVKMTHGRCNLPAHQKIGALNFVRPDVVINRYMDALGSTAVEYCQSFAVDLAIDAQNRWGKRL